MVAEAGSWNLSTNRPPDELLEQVAMLWRHAGHVYIFSWLTEEEFTYYSGEAGSKELQSWLSDLDIAEAARAYETDSAAEDACGESDAHQWDRSSSFKVWT